MAAKSGGEATTKGLGEDDLAALCEALHPVSKKYTFLGLQLGVKKSEIDMIEAQHDDPGKRLLEILSARMRKAKILTWADVDKALRSAWVDEIKLAESIKEKYGHPFSKGSSPQERDTKRRKRKGRRGESPLPRGRGSDRQEEDSEREVSGQVRRKKYPQPLSSKEKESISKAKKARERIEESSPHHTLHTERIKRKDRKNKKSTEVQSERSMYEGRVQKEKQSLRKEKAVRCKISETESSDNESINQTGKQQKMTKVKVESDNESSASSSEEEAESLPIESETRGKSGKSEASAKHAEMKSELKQQERKGKKIQRKEKDRHQRAADERAQYSDGEVRKKPAHRSKSELVSENESSISSSTEEETSESEIPSVKIVSDTRSEKKYHEKDKMKAPKEKQTGKKQKTQSEKEHFPPCSMKERDLERKRIAQLGESTKAVSREKYLKVHSKQHKDRAGISRERAAVKEKEAAARHSEPDTAGSDSTQDESEGEESEGGGKDEEDRDLQQRSSSEEEEEVPEDVSSASTSEEEVTTKSKRVAPTEKQSVKEKETKKGNDRRVAADDEESDCGGRSRDEEEHDIQSKKKRGRRRHREGGASPTARGSSSPSTSQEEKPQQQPDPGGQRRKREHRSDNTGKKKKKERKQGEGAKSPSASETGDSSPECDMIRNLSKADRKKLVKTFKQFFGHLCCEITNPVQIAAQLQKKGLISHSMMKDMIVSPESRQAKTIGLVGALDKKIKSHPDRLFLFIDILLEDETPKLQQAGREMLEKTGEICPDRKLSSKPTLSQTATSSSQAAGKKQEVQPNKVEHSNPQIVGGDNTLSSLEVSLYVPRSGLSPVLTMYKGYLKSYYNARTLAPADKYLPTLDAPYINLAMISRKYYSPDQRDEFTRQTLHGGVDEILQSKTPISIEDLLTPERGGRPVRFILVEGPPGIGKSTFSWEVCRRWDEIERLRDYHTVVLLKLREKWVLNATSPSDLFRFPSDPELSKAIARALYISHGNNLLLILDGFDEVSHSFHENSIIKSILCRQLLPGCTIILTTRPVAKSALRSICQPWVDKHIEIIGFTEEERVRYITEVFSKEPELQVNFLKYMFLVPHIKSMMYIPLNCAIIAQVYYESQSSHHLAIPKTRTQLYKALTNSLLVRHMKMKEGNHEYTTMLPEGLDDVHMEKFKILAKFAFDTYHKDGARKVTFFTEDIPVGLVHFGFMNESTEMYAGKGIGRTFSFLHLSLQEYLAAWHLADNYSIEFLVAYQKLATDINPNPKNLSCLPSSVEEKAFLSSLKQQRSSLKEPAIFLAGITGWRSKSECGRNHWEMYLSHDTTAWPYVLLPSLYEAQNPDILPYYFAGESSSRKYHGNARTPYESYALSYCLAHSSYQIRQLDVMNRENTSLLETFVKGLDDHCKTVTPNVQQLQVKSYINPHQSLSWLVKSKLIKLKRVINICRCICSAQINFLQSLICVEFLKIHVDSVESWEWLSALLSLSELKMLHISTKNECSPPPTNLVCWLIEHRLTTLVLDIKFPSNTEYNVRSSSTDILVDSVLMSVLSANRITELVLSNIIISRETMASVHSILLHCPSLTTLELKRTRLGYDGILHICSALRNNVTLRSLTIFDSCSSRSGYYNSPVLFSSMKRVPLPSRTTCTEFLLELNNILKENTILEVLKIQSGLFFPLSTSAGSNWERHQWTGLGPLQQFNVGAVGSDMSPNLRRSFSSSDLTQPQTTLFWDRRFYGGGRGEINFRKLFSKKQKRRKKLFSLPSFTAPDTQVLQSFSGLDPRLKECLNMSYLNQYVNNLSYTYMSLLNYLNCGSFILPPPLPPPYTIEFEIC